MNNNTTYRSHTCGELRIGHVGQTVKLAGFLDNVREVSASLAFAVLRDFYGVTQLVVEDEALLAQLKGLNKESTLCVTGTVRERASKNPKLPTGDIEVVPETIEVLGRCRHNELPFPISRSREADESGLATWVGLLESGTTREEVFNGFAGSNEFTNLCGQYGITRGDGLPVPAPGMGTIPGGEEYYASWNYGPLRQWALLSVIRALGSAAGIELPKKGDVEE